MKDYGKTISEYIMIDSFEGKWEAFSNFYTSNDQCIPFVARDENVYISHNVETVCQAHKASTFTDQLCILSAKTPGSAKRRGNEIILRPDWERIKFGVMFHYLDVKFRHARLRDILMSTGNEEIVEVNDWNDHVWGMCVDIMTGELIGSNWLGMLLMLLRSGEHLPYREINSHGAHRNWIEASEIGELTRAESHAYLL